MSKQIVITALCNNILFNASLGWGGGIRTPECMDQNHVPYHLATPQNIGIEPILIISHHYLPYLLLAERHVISYN